MSPKDDAFFRDDKTVIRPTSPPLPASGGDRTVLARQAHSPAPAERTVIAGPPDFDTTGRLVSDGGHAVPSPYPGENPLVAAAAPLLMLLGRAERARAAPSPLEIAAAVRLFQTSVASAGLPAEDVRTATYAVCETADDIARALPGTDVRDWTERGMLATFFDARSNGAGFFEALNRILADPAGHADLLELMHACLALGFEGQYRGRGDAREGLRKVRADVLGTLRHLRPAPAEDLTPRWQGVRAAREKRSARMLFWSVMAGAPAFAALIFVTLSLLIDRQGDTLADRLVALVPEAAVQIDRAALAAPAPSAAPPTPAPDGGPDLAARVRAALSADVEAGSVAIAERQGEIVVTIDNALLFGPGRADLKPDLTPLAGRLAAMLSSEPTGARIVGHTDNVKPGRNSAFPSNEELSVARARAVRDAIAGRMQDASRLSVEGKGDAEPIADNATAEGRAANRRVDIVIPLGPLR